MFALILLNLDLELFDLIFMLFLSAVELGDVVKVEALSFNGAHLFPDGETLISQLFVDARAASRKELLGLLVLLDVESPRLEAIIPASASPRLAEPSDFLLDVFESSQLLYL